MKRFLVTLGVPSDFVLEEDKSKNTFQNGLYTYELLSRRGIKDICLVTSAYHMPRAFRIFSSLPFSKIVPIPADFRVNRTGYSWVSFVPRMGVLRDSYEGIHEYLGILYFDLIQKKKLLKWRAREDSNLRPTD